MPGTSTTPSGATPAGYVPNFARRDGAAADPTPAPPSTADVPHIAPELITQVMTLEAANEARRVIADARRRLAEIAARAPQTPLVRHPDEAPPARREAPPTLHAITARRTPPTLRAQPTLTSSAATSQDPPTPTPTPAPPAASTGLSREYEWEQAVKAPYERPAVAPPAPVRRARRSGTGQSREYEWEQAVKAPYQPPPQKGPAGVLESLKSAAFPSPNPTPDQRRSERS